MTFLESGNGERLKLAWHGGLFVLCAGAVVYNAAAWLQRRERHLAMNTALYVAGVLIEGVQVSRHLENGK